ncbi:unnamed protein product [Linum tenue]|uniref:Uncharacterized protein n=1 Tax=Linum tenue TaxID=586396 RepID=A0AAV0HVL8_9ROSI|nr:unnamed protein product [Linum tenue]
MCRYLINYAKVLEEMYFRHCSILLRGLLAAHQKPKDSGFGDFLQIKPWQWHFPISFIDASVFSFTVPFFLVSFSMNSSFFTLFP